MNDDTLIAAILDELISHPTPGGDRLMADVLRDEPDPDDEVEHYERFE
jgi:hypothetical protein